VIQERVVLFKRMKLLVVGSGGREHALVRALARDGLASVACAPGNAGIALDAPVFAVDASDPEAVLALAERERVDLTVVGPELPLDRGIVDRFERAGRRIFGPTRAAAQLECSKVFAKEFMSRHGIPTARYRVCESPEAAHTLVGAGELGLPVVVKADGLAAGKGVVVAATAGEAHAAVREAMEERRFGDAGTRIVVEECLSGPEVSFFAICDGTRAMPLASAQDHKRAFDDDAGPNTGGMGAFSPSPLVDAGMQARIMSEIVDPVLRGMNAEGHDYRGFLYAGLMLTCSGPKVIEFNVRFGDPEAQVVLPLIEGGLVDALSGAAEGRSRGGPVTMSSDVCVGVVVASSGYPGTVKTGVAIAGIENAGRVPGVTVFHAATTVENGRFLTSGGRVLTVVGRAASYDDAIARAYEGVSKISFDGMHHRKDIGRKALRV
jgi:phosphoribosylamine--glycine ligase